MTIPKEEMEFKDLFDQFVQAGKVEWIGVRGQSNETMVELNTILAEIGGLQNDRSNKGLATSKRQVTLIQKEDLEAVASFLNLDSVSPQQTRRNIVVSGINLNALKGKPFKIGEAELFMTNYCYPCSKMEKRLGKGGFNAMRGRGGITCAVITPGKISIGDSIII
ncbi:MAG: MOSC domain-containing protein [Leadbetterella sp.]